MFSLNQIYLLNSAKEEGKEWLVMAYDEAMEQIRSKIEEMDLFTIFQKELFNQRDPLVILEIDRRMEMNHPLMDVLDAHTIMMENDGYEKLAEEMEDVKLSYKVSDDSNVIKLKMEFRPRPQMPPLPDSDDDEVARKLDFEPTKCCFEGCTNDAGWCEGPCTGCYLRNATDADSYLENDEFRRNVLQEETENEWRLRRCVYPGCDSEGVNGGYCDLCAERNEVYDEDDRNKASLQR